MYIWYICIYTWYIYIYIYVYTLLYTNIYIYDIPSSYPFVEHLLPWHRQEPDSEGFLQKDPMKPQIQRLFEAQQTGPQKAGPKSTRNGRKPMETMDLQHGHGNIMVFLPWFFHSWKMNIGRCKFRTVTCKSSNPITKAKTHIMKTHTHIYIHRCTYIYIYLYLIYLYLYQEKLPHFSHDSGGLRLGPLLEGHAGSMASGAAAPVGW